MPVYDSKLNTHADNFIQNTTAQKAKLEMLRTLEARAITASEKRRPRFEERNQLTPHDRLTLLLDPSMPYLPLYNMAGYCVDDINSDTSVPGGSVMTGIGFVSGARVMVAVDDSGINAGAVTEMGFRKVLRAIEIAYENKLPFIHLVESAGANLMTYKVELWAHAGSVFYMLAKMSAAGIPTMTVLHGPSTAGGAYMPGMSDYNVGVKNNGMAALGGAALVQAATGEIADERELGGTEMHSTTTGLIEYLADDDVDGLRQIRDVLEMIGWNEHCTQPPERDFKEPIYNSEELLGLVPDDYKVPYESRELIARLVDNSEFTDFKARYGSNLVCVQTRIFGHPVALVANNGPMGPDEAAKGAQFYQLIDQANHPLIFLHNITGYMVGTEYEKAGMIKHGAKMIQAASNIRVPKLSFHVGASFGAGNYGMVGFGYKPDFLFAWPSARTGVMSGESAAGTMETVAINIAKRKGLEPDLKAIRKQSEAIMGVFTAQEDAFYTSGRMLDHGVIDPRDTRKIIGFLLQTIWERQHRSLQSNAFGVGRM